MFASDLASTNWRLLFSAAFSTFWKTVCYSWAILALVLGDAEYASIRRYDFDTWARVHVSLRRELQTVRDTHIIT